MTVVTPDVLATTPAQNYGDLLRAVPGMNVVQTSARDINIVSRQSTGTLSASQLTLLDGRSIYLDFFGMVLWDFLPSNTEDIKQIEVVRGPASAVWGANALTGVVNIITKTPREGKGFTAAAQGGFFDRDVGSTAGEGSGNTYAANMSWANAPNDTWSYRLAAGYYFSDPYARPTGTVPLDTHPLDHSIRTGGAVYPDDRDAARPGEQVFKNTETQQPKVDLRVDQELGNGGRITYSGGYAGTDGIIHTGIGPFDIQSGSGMGYGRIAYSKGALRIATFANLVSAEAPNLLLVDPATLQPVQLNFKTQTYDFEIGHSTVLAGKHIMSYGGNARRNNFDISLAPTAEDRNEFGAYFQWEYFADKFRLTAGGRVDKFGNIDDPVFSPRVTAMFKPSQDHTIRVSYNKAFRSPSAINNFLDQRIFAPGVPPIDLRPLIPVLQAVAPPLVPLVPSQPVRLIVRNVGNEVGSTSGTTTLKAESLTAYEISYTGTFGRTTLGIAAYQNDSDDNINFTTVLPSTSAPTGIVPPFDVYTPANSSEIGIPGPLYQFLLAAHIPGFPLPRTATTYLNLGPLRQRGVEVSLDHRFNDKLSASANYSWQDTPEPLDPDSGQLPYFTEEIALPATNRFNVQLNWNDARFLGSASVNYSDKAFWSDVLQSQFHGYTDSYAMVNAYFGVRWSGGKFVTSLKGTNLFNEEIQQHVFGDLLKRTVSLELRYNF